MSKTVTKTRPRPRHARRPRRRQGGHPDAPSRPAAVGPVGFVSFVGSGPGDPELLTVRAADLLREAEIVVTEAPEHAALVALAPAGRGRRRRLRHRRPAADPRRPRQGRGQAGQERPRVVRLMAGDPFVYASGPEEAQACVKAGVAFEIVPGVSSVTAVPAYAGVPLTDKKHREVAVVNCSEAKIDWSAYADDRTLVLLSAVGAIGEVAKALVDAGRAPETPVAMTRVGTTTEQETVVSTLDRIAADARAARMTPPAVTVVGDVVDLRTTLRGSRPSRCSAGGSWCRAPRSRPARCRRGCAASARCPRRCRRSRSSRRATRSRWTRRSAAWSRAATSGSRSPRSTRSGRCARSSTSTASTPAPSPG